MLAAVVAVCCVGLGFPFTYLLTGRGRRVQVAWLVALLAVLSLSEAIIGFAWSTLLSRTAGISNRLVAVGLLRSEGRRVGHECVCTCRYRCSPQHKKQTEKNITKYNL